MIVIKIHAWHPEQAYGSYELDAIERRLEMYTNLKKREITQLAKQIRDQTCQEISLAKAKDRYEAHSMRSLLDGLGAETSVEEL